MKLIGENQPAAIQEILKVYEDDRQKEASDGFKQMQRIARRTLGNSDNLRKNEKILYRCIKDADCATAVIQQLWPRLTEEFKEKLPEGYEPQPLSFHN